ncbi:hypothetical protein SEVIR_4G187000v4 [Setaria viridis]|uniref:Uncharacterized protein n=1 Tax=Setaria viridis TaxID=4556 RepID=A0A4U6V036_SETVI|nr:hypothetical protein SEVIR_4G187000v2 [Setaria viridis]
MAPANEASPRSSSPLLLMGLSPDAPAEDIAYVLGDVRRAQSRVESKRAALQEQIAAASSRRGNKRRAPPRRAQLPAANDAPLLPAAADDPGACGYTRKGGAGAVRRRLRAAAADVKKERKRLEAVRGDLEEALVDAREMLALHGGGTA